MNQSPAERSERWLCHLEEKTHKLVGRSRTPFHANVKIALLDSGIDGKHGVFLTRRTRIKAFKSWVAEPVDEFAVEGLSKRTLARSCYDMSGHGTHKAALILRVAPWADLYIGRVVEGKRNLEADNVASVRMSSLKCKLFLTLEGYKLGRQSVECRYHLSSFRLSSTCRSHFKSNYGRCTKGCHFRCCLK